MLEERWMLRTEYQPYILRYLAQLKPSFLSSPSSFSHSVNSLPLGAAPKKWGWTRPPQFELKGRKEGRIQSFTEERYSFALPTDGIIFPFSNPSFQ